MSNKQEAEITLTSASLEPLLDNAGVEDPWLLNTIKKKLESIKLTFEVDTESGDLEITKLDDRKIGKIKKHEENDGEPKVPNK